MPIIISIDADRQLVTCVGQGILTKEEMSGHIRTLQAMPTFNKNYRQLWDMTEVSEVAITFTDMMWIAEMNVFSLTTPRAFLAPTNALFGVARMFEMLRQAKGETGIRVFRERAEALKWLAEAPASVPVSEK